MEITIIVKNNLIKKKEKIGTNVRVREYNAGLLARSQFPSRRSCDRPNILRFSVVFLGPRAMVELPLQSEKASPTIM
jgi:hypothetical protein